MGLKVSHLVTLSQVTRGLTRYHITNIIKFVIKSKFMEISKAKQLLSEARMNRYLIACDFKYFYSIEMYKKNLNVSKAFHPVLSLFEVILRNKLNTELSKKSNDANWILKQLELQNNPDKFTFSTSLNIKFKLPKNLKNLTPDNIISEQSFGFWTCFFENYNFKILKGCPLNIFPTRPIQIKRKEIYLELNKIRRFRNRINHNEPICFNKNKIDFSEAIEVYNSILNLLQWIDPEIIDFINPIDNVLETINKKDPSSNGS